MKECSNLSALGPNGVQIIEKYCLLYNHNCIIFLIKALILMALVILHDVQLYVL